MTQLAIVGDGVVIASKSVNKYEMLAWKIRRLFHAHDVGKKLCAYRLFSMTW
jgi:hypothetical protein